MVEGSDNLPTAAPLNGAAYQRRVNAPLPPIAGRFRPGKTPPPAGSSLTSFTTQRYGPYAAIADVIMGMVRNPDALLARDRFGYDRVNSNPVVKAELSTLSGPIVTSKIVVENTGHEAIDTGLSKLFNGMDGKSYLIREMVPAYITGLRIIESAWGLRATEFGEMWLPVGFYPHSNQRFARDAASGLVWMTQDGSSAGQIGRNDLTWTETGYPEFVKYGKLIWHTYRDGDGTYGYGWGEGINLYRWVCAYDAAFSFWVSFAQQFGLPIKVMGIDHDYVKAMGAVDEDAETVYAAYRDQVNDLIENDTLVTDVRNELKLLSPDGGLSGATGFFRELLNFIAEQIRVTMTGESVTQTAAEGGTGNSLAKSKEAAKLRTARQLMLAADVATTLKRDLLDVVLHFNRHLFRGLSINDAAATIRLTTPRVSEEARLELMLKSPFPVHEDDFYELSELRKPTPADVAHGRALTPALMSGSAQMGASFGGF